MPVTIDDDTASLLVRMRYLNILICNEQASDDEINEYREALALMVRKFLPVLQLLAKAGVLNIDVSQPTDSEQDKMVGLEVQGAYENGGIFLAAGDVMMSEGNMPLVLDWDDAQTDRTHST